MKWKGKLKNQYGPYDPFCLKQFKEYIFTLKKKDVEKCLPTWKQQCLWGEQGGGGFHSFLFYVSWFLQEACAYVYHIYK